MTLARRIALALGADPALDRTADTDRIRRLQHELAEERAAHAVTRAHLHGTDPDAGDGPDPTWYRAELDAARTRIAHLEQLARTLADALTDVATGRDYVLHLEHGGMPIRVEWLDHDDDQADDDPTILRHGDDPDASYLDQLEHAVHQPDEVLTLHRGGVVPGPKSMRYPTDVELTARPPIETTGRPLEQQRRPPIPGNPWPDHVEHITIGDDDIDPR